MRADGADWRRGRKLRQEIDQFGRYSRPHLQFGNEHPYALTGATQGRPLGKPDLNMLGITQRTVEKQVKTAVHYAGSVVCRLSHR